MNNVDAEWENYCNNEENGLEDSNKKNDIVMEIPKCSELYISTKTKIAYLDTEIELNKIFWDIPITDYHLATTGVIKKQIKINCDTKEDVEILEKKIAETPNLNFDIIQKIDNPNGRKIKFKDVRKINIGLCSNDLTTKKKKKTGAFYNCFVLIYRLNYQNKFKEMHVKIFNTGKLEIPGVQNDILFETILNKVVELLSPYFNKEIKIVKDKIQTVLINSNFCCNYYIKRDVLFDRLKYKYNLNVIYDPCSYPGIQCKFYYNILNPEINGRCCCEVSCYQKKKKKKIKKINKCTQISFMIFRTGSVLIVGHCTEVTLNITYKFIMSLLEKEFKDIHLNVNYKKKEKKKKKKIKKTIFVCENKY
ncbi:MAG: hypothetical protein CML42_08200 [Rhodobacteraceae bacterium]|nr:hypothetical protein [Paracoccaceae bacterium]|tara:strand:- start:68213 stop:69301 length:1089 start_codon:yes stop_codon:yes gene_type:complete